MIAGKGRTWAGLRLTTTVLALVMLAAACESSPTEGIGDLPVASVEVMPPELDLMKGDTLRLHAVPRSSAGQPLLDRTVSWTVLGGGGATVSVSSTGLLTALAGGRAQVRATAGGVHGISDVTVIDPATPAPVIAQLSPSTIMAGSGAFALTVVGTGFAEGSRVLWGGEARPTTRVDATRLVAQIGAADVAAAGSAHVQVESPPPGGGHSEPAVLTIQPAGGGSPGLTQLSPATVPAGSNGFTLTVRGRSFAHEAVVLWNGAPRTTTRVSEGELRAEIAVSDVWAAGTARVSVRHTGGGGEIGPLEFTVAAAGISRIALAPDTLRLLPGEEAHFQARILGLDGSDVGDRYQAWSSLDGTVVQVFGDGSVRALRPGTTTVRLAVSDVAATATVVVGPYAVQHVAVSPPEPVVLAGGSVQMRARLFGLGGVELFDRVVAWTVADPEIASVDGQGRVVGLRRGVTRVVAESEGRSNWTTIEVREWPAGAVWTFDLELDPFAVRPAVGDTTWVDAGGVTRRADLYLVDATLVVDRALDTYVQTFRLQMIEGGTPGPIVTREDRGSARGVSWPEEGLVFTSSVVAGGTFAGRVSGPAELTLEQRVGTDILRSYLYVIR